MNIAARDMSFFPPYSSKVSYIGANGNPYILTNAKACSELVVTINFPRQDIRGSANILSGGVRWSGYLWQFDAAWNRKGQFAYGTARQDGLGLDFVSHANELRFDRNKVYANNVLIKEMAYEEWSTDYELAIFATNRSGTISERATATANISSLKIEKAGEVLHDFIPVRVQNVAYLYDQEHPFGGPSGNGLYGNCATAGNFLFGDDIS